MTKALTRCLLTAEYRTFPNGCLGSDSEKLGLSKTSPPVERAERLGIAGVQKPAQLRTCRRTRPIGLPIGDIQGVGRAMLQFVTRKNFQHGRELTPGSGQSA